MKDFGKVYSANQPKEVEIIGSQVFVASNITPYEKEIDGYIDSGYEYDYKQYSVEEYIAYINEKNQKTIDELSDELQATKILLGVE